LAAYSWTHPQYRLLASHCRAKSCCTTIILCGCSLKSFVNLWVDYFGTSLQLQRNVFVFSFPRALQLSLEIFFTFLYIVLLYTAVDAGHVLHDAYVAYVFQRKPSRTRAELPCMRDHLRHASHSRAGMLRNTRHAGRCKSALISRYAQYLINP
jgi:hypothetical protein